MRTVLAGTLVGALVLGLGCSSPPSPGGRTRPGPGSALAVPPVDTLPELPADPREGLLSQATIELLSSQHVLHRAVDDQVSDEAFPKYLEALDGAKLNLLQSDVDALTAYRDQMDDELRAGALVLARKGAAVFQERHKAVAAMVAELLAAPFDFTVDESFETDPDKRAYARTEAELRDRWRMLLKLSVLERVDQMEELLAAKDKPARPGAGSGSASDAVAKALAEIPATPELREAKAREELAGRFATRFLREATPEKLEPLEQFLNAVAAVYDPHTVYLAPSEKANFDIAISGTLIGIGAALREQDHYVVVEELVPGGASWQQGKLVAGDLILAVAQDGESPVDVTDMPLDRVVSMIRGPKDTLVTLTVKKPAGDIATITIKRDVVKIEATYARGAVLKPTAKDKDKVGYVYLPGFYGELDNRKKDRNATDDIRALLAKLEARHIGSLVLDLRSNGGGILAHARDISGLFIDTGPVVQTRDTQGKIDILSDKDAGVTYTGNVVVMVDRFSASAAEILAAALQDYQRAVVVGNTTHGKGTVQTFVDLDQLARGHTDPLGVFKITIEQYFRVTGASVQLRGVVPDITLPDSAAYIESGERTLFHPIPWSSVDTASFKPVDHAWTTTALASASALRVKAEPAFAKIEAFTKILSARRDQTMVSLERTKWKADRKKALADVDAADPKLSEGKARFAIDLLDEGPAAVETKDKQVQAKLDKWKDMIARDPFVDEALHVLADMGAATR